MSGTLYAMDLLQSGTGFMIAGLIGILFGFFLEQAGFGSSRKLTAIFYFRDMAVLKVMFTAVIVALLGYRYLVAMGWLIPDQVHALDTYWWAQILGGLVFGVGFVVGGWCPGTAFVGLASAKLDALVFLVGAVAGSVLFNELYGLVQPIYEGMHGGTLYLYQSLNISPNLLILAFCLVAIAAFAASTLLERRIGKLPRAGRASTKRHAIAAVVLILFALGLFITPERTAEVQAEAGRTGFVEEIFRAEDRLDPLELADLLMDGTSEVTVVDLRTPGEYEDFHIRGAINVPLGRLGREANERLPRSGLIVMYSDGTTHAAQAWMQLRGWGWKNVRVLTDGLLGFWRDCLTPPSLTGLTDKERASERFSRFKARKEFFIQPDMKAKEG